MHGLHIALGGGALIPDEGGCRILGHAAAALKQRGEAVLGRRQTGKGCLLIPMGGAGYILGDAFAIEIARGDNKLRGGVAPFGGAAERFASLIQAEAFHVHLLSSRVRQQLRLELRRFLDLAGNR